MTIFFVNKTRLLVALLAVVSLCALSGCGKPDVALVGSYGVANAATGAVDPLVKIEAFDNPLAGDLPKAYVIYEFDKGAWHKPVNAWASGGPSVEPVIPFTKVDLEKIVKHPIDVDVEGVQVRGFAVVHVPAGWSESVEGRSFVSKTGYFAITLLGPVELRRL